MARSPWLALTAAGLGIMGGDSPYAGVNIGKGGLEGIKYLDKQRAAAREEENTNQAAKRLMQQAESTREAMFERQRAQRETERHNRETEASRRQFLKQSQEAKDAKATAPKNLTQNVVKDLSAAGSAFSDFNRLAQSWDDKYGGSGSETIGDIKNWLGSRDAMGYGDQSKWWRDYQEQKNVIRKSLFGSALTKTEKTEFDKATINPGMSAAQIRDALGRQASAAARAAKKLGKTWKGVNPEMTENALGIDPDTIDDRIVIHSTTPTDPGLDAELKRRKLQ